MFDNICFGIIYCTEDYYEILQCKVWFHALQLVEFRSFGPGKDNHGCVASGAYRYRKITLPGNPKAQWIQKCVEMCQDFPKPFYPFLFWSLQLSTSRQLASSSRTQSNWWCVLSSDIHTGNGRMEYDGNRMMEYVTGTYWDNTTALVLIKAMNAYHLQVKVQRSTRSCPAAPNSHRSRQQFPVDAIGYYRYIVELWRG